MAAPSAQAQAGGAPTPQHAALDLVQPLRPILAGFNHRNRNQHRGARWWGSLGMLRRHLDKLAGELEASVAGARRGRKPKRGRDGGGGGGSSEDGPAETRARWLRDVLVPGCYVAFSQLAADNQFATLGVVLLGVLAQVDTACRGLVGEVVDVSSSPAPAEPTVREMEAPGSLGGVADDAIDLGQVVSREEVNRSAKLLEKSQEPRAKRKMKEAGDAPPTKKQKEKEDVTPPAVKLAAGKEKSSKKKKKGKKGDEFDDLFSSLF